MKISKFHESKKIRPTKITQVSRFLYRVEQEMNGGFWVTVHDTPGIPWCDVKRYLPPFSRGYPESPHLCDWCHKEPKAFLAVSDQGKELICHSCAGEVPRHELN